MVQHFVDQQIDFWKCKSNSLGGESFQQMVLELLDTHKKNELACFTCYTN